MDIMDQLGRLKQLLSEISDLHAIAELLQWDQQTMLPSGAAPGRAEQLETLERTIHRRSQSAALGRLLDKIPENTGSPEDQALLRRARRDFRKHAAIPVALAGKIAATTARATAAWLQARETDDFRILAPHLEKLFSLKREYAGCFPEAETPYDALLDLYEEGMTTRELDPLFAELRREQTALVRAWSNSAAPLPALPPGSFPATRQRALSRRVAIALGYDTAHGRLDEVEHPFTITIGSGDVRITTAIKPGQPLSALFSTIHECGHALYEQGINPAFDRTPLADGASLGFHESQSRFYENQLARSKPFWEYFYPALQRSFPAVRSLALEDFMRIINNVEPSLIRTEADEATYNLHILLRYELERGILDQTVRVADLPELWREKMREYLGVIPETDRDGVLQDIHWPGGDFGYFPTYALGNLIAGELREKMLRELPDVEAAIRNGDFQLLREYLRREIHRFGAQFTPRELHLRLFGTEKISAQPYLRYLRGKFSHAS